MKLSDQERDRMHKELIKLADIMETTEPGESDYTYYQRQYKKISKALFPELYKSKPRKPSRQFIISLLPCTCGSTHFKYTRQAGMHQIKCAECDMAGLFQLNRNDARDSWNKIVKKNGQ